MQGDPRQTDGTGDAAPGPGAGILVLNLKASMQQVVEARKQLAAFVEGRQASARTRYAAALAVEELLTNIVKHGYREDDRADVTLRVSWAGNTLTLVFEDQGPAFDPTAAPEPAPATALADAAIGGLGINMVRNQVTRMLYSRMENTNRLEVIIEEQSP